MNTSMDPSIQSEPVADPLIGWISAFDLHCEEEDYSIFHQLDVFA